MTLWSFEGMGRVLVMGLGVLALSACATMSPKDPLVVKKATFHYELANNAYFAGSPMEALQELDTVLAIDSEHVEAHHLLGMIHFGRDEFERARVHLQRALELDPEMRIARNNLGALNLRIATEFHGTNVAAELQWTREAIRVLEPLVGDRLYPTPHLLHNNLGTAFHVLGNVEKAEFHFQRAIRLKPRMCRAHCNLGRLYKEERRFDLSVRFLDRALDHCKSQVEKGFNEPYLHLGEVYELTGQMQPAIESYRMCYEAGPGTPYGLECGARLSGLGVGAAQGPFGGLSR
jgi:Flp pilus assembly protein TadD